MIRDLTIGQYFPSNSLLHKTDPRVKLILLMASLILIFCTFNYVSISIMIVFVLMAIVVSGVPLKLYIKSLKTIILIMIFTSLLNIFNDEGNVLFEFGFISITDVGVNNTIFISIRITCLLLLSAIFTFTTLPTDLTDSVEKLLSPLKIFRINVSDIAMMMTIAIRFIPTLLEETEKIINSQKSRGADFDSKNIFQKVRSLTSIVVPLLAMSFKRAYELAIAMESRCYQGGNTRTRMKVLKVKTLDILIICTFIMFMLGVIYCNILFPRTRIV